MKVLKIEHSGKSSEGAKIAISLSSDKSIGAILNPGEFILSQDQNTAPLDSQKRRGYVNVDYFDNVFNLELGVKYPVSLLEEKQKEIDELNSKENEPFDKLSEAQKDATDYMNTPIE